MIARVIEERGGGFAADAPLLHQKGNGFLNGGVLEPCVGGTGLRLALAVLRGGGNAVEGLILVGVGKQELFRLGGVPGGLVDDALFAHFVQNQLLPFLVELAAGLVGAVVLLELGVPEGVVQRGVVGDADNGGALRQAQLGDVLAKIALGGGLNPVVALTEEDPVKVLGDDILLGDVGVLLELQGPENLPEFPFDGNFPVVVHIPQHLLGDSRAAAGSPAGNSGLDGAGGADPVNALVCPEAFVLNSYQGVHQMSGEVVKLNQLPVAAGIAAVIKQGEDDLTVFVIDCRGQGERQLLGAQLPQGGDKGGVNVGHKDFEENSRRGDTNNAQGK